MLTIHNEKDFGMTDNVLQNLEDRVMQLLAELECIQAELTQLRRENSNLKTEKSAYIKKLQGLIGLIDALDRPEATDVNATRRTEEECAVV
jgi:regulator of replication initiation timing